jgi:hypothetical protein
MLNKKEKLIFCRAEVRQARTVADISSPVGVVRTNKIDKQLQTKQKITPKVSNIAGSSMQ